MKCVNINSKYIYVKSQFAYMLDSRSQNTQTSCFARKVKSPYVHQYLTFEQRINSQPQLKGQNLAIRCALQRTKNNNSQQNNIPMNQLKNIISNKAPVWTQDKENMLAILDQDHLVKLKNKINQLKEQHNPSVRPTPQESRVRDRLKSQGNTDSYKNKESRTISQYSQGSHLSVRKEVMNFIQYKKNRRQLSIKMRRF